MEEQLQKRAQVTRVAHIGYAFHSLERTIETVILLRLDTLALFPDRLFHLIDSRLLLTKFGEPFPLNVEGKPRLKFFGPLDLLFSEDVLGLSLNQSGCFLVLFWMTTVNTHAKLQQLDQIPS